jgi:Trehalase
MTGLASRGGAAPATDDDRLALLASARELLEANWTGASTVPSRGLYPHQWSWDAAFVAIGRSRLDQRRAARELESLFRGQWANGMVPHIVFNPAVPEAAYFPGPGFWSSGRLGAAPAGVATSGITQPPLHARAALEVYRNAPDRGAARVFLARLYPRLVAQHRYLARRRDPAGHGLAAIVHPWESGLDNSPVWDAPLAAVALAPGAVAPYRRRDLAHAEAADRPTDADYDRFVCLAARYRDSGYDDTRLAADSPFLVEDPLFNAVWLWSAHALAEIARLVGADPRPHLATARRLHDGLLTHLWEPSAGRFYARDLRQGRLIEKLSVVSLAPLLDPELPAAQVEAIVADLRSPHFQASGSVERFLVPSYDLLGPEFSRRRYWRGPVWMNTSWLLWRGLRQHGQERHAADLRASTVRLVRRSGFREYFDPYSGAGHGSGDLSWTAALVVDLLLAPAPG